MSLSKEYTEEQLNYFRICYAFTDILAEGLREIFRQEWDIRHKLTKGEWKDEPQNGMDFYNGESFRNKRRYAHLLATMQNGNRGEWDCSMLFYAILFSDCVGPSLSAAVRKNVDDLRNFRNQEFAHKPEGSLSDIDFQNAISKLGKAFQALGLPTVKIQDLKVQRTYATAEFRNILKEVDDLKQEVQVRVQSLEDELRKISPSFCILPPKPSHDIGGREREVSEIAQQLRELKESSHNKLSILYISGNPGSGKSQLAGLVAQRFFDEVKEIPGGSSFVMTLDAATSVSLLESYASLARCLKCPDYSVMETLSSKDWNVEKKITNLKMLISGKVSCYTSWLLVVDNVTTMSSVYSHLPQCGNEAWAMGQLLITTQNTKIIPLKSSFVYHVSVSKGMNPDDACSLLVKVSGIQDSELVTKVAQELDYQPLALVGAAVFVKEMRQDEASRNFGWNEYLKILKKDRSEPTKDILAYTNPIYPKSMTKAMMLALETLMRSDELVKHLFIFLSLCAPQHLTVDIVISYIVNVLKQCDEADEELIRMRLRRCSLLLFEDSQGGYFIRVHQVVYDAIKTLMNNTPEGQTPEVVNAVISSFDTFINVVPPENRRLETMHIVPHLKALTMVTDRVFMKENLFQVHNKDISDQCENLAQICEMHSELNVAKTYWQYSLTVNLEKVCPKHADVTRGYNKLATLYMALGDLEKAKEYQERALAIQFKKLGVASVPVATSYSNLASIYKDLDDLQQAKAYQQRALAIGLDKLGPEHVDVARSFTNLASIYMDLGDLEQAKEYQQRALAITLDKLGPEDVDVARSYNKLALIYHNLGDLEQAKEYQQRALLITRSTLGAEHVDVATSYNNLASIYKDLGDLEKAKEYQQHALHIQLKALDPEHVSVASSFNNLASIHLALGDLLQAKDYQQHALDIEIKKVGPKDVSVATSFNNLASIYLALSDLERAKEYQQYALAIQLEKFGPEHVSVASSYSNLAIVYLDLGDLQQAKECQERALKILLKKLGPKHYSVAANFSNLASIFKAMGDLEQAKEYQQRALAIEIDKVGPHHISVATSYNNLASISKAVGDPKQAMEYQQRALAIQLTKLGPNHVSVASSYSNLASIFMALGDLEQAMEYQQRALNIQLKMLGSEHVSVASSYSNLGSIYLDLGDLEQAKQFQQRALAIRLHKLGSEHVSVATSYSNLAPIFMTLGDLEQAKEYQQRALAIQLEKLGPEHASVASSFNNLASIYKALGDLEQAKEYQRHALAILLKKVGRKEIGP